MVAYISKTTGIRPGKNWELSEPIFTRRHRRSVDLYFAPKAPSALRKLLAGAYYPDGRNQGRPDCQLHGERRLRLWPNNGAGRI